MESAEAKNFVMKYEYDYLVIGSGIAGMSFALKVAREEIGRAHV